MIDLNQFSIKITDFKCFGSEPQGFDRIAPFNIIIGRNNSGKSSLIDILPCLTKSTIEIPNELWRGSEEPKIFACSPLPEEVVRKVFSESARGNILGRIEPQAVGRNYIGTKIKWHLNTDKERFPKFGKPKSTILDFSELRESAAKYKEQLARTMPNPFKNLEFRRIRAERTIVPGSDTPNPEIDENDGGTTRLIQQYINKAALPRQLVEETVLEHLNKIFSPDAEFTDIVCQQFSDGKWEVFLKEEQKDFVSLSQSGSGLKTVIIVLVNILLIV